MEGTLPEGNFLDTEFWPRLVSGMPDKSDLIAAQNEVLAAQAITERKERNDQHRQVMEAHASHSTV